MVHGNCIIFSANIICFPVMGKCVMLNEYSCQIPANRIGFVGNGGPFSLMQLKVIQEVITLIIFTVFTTVFFKGETLHWNHLAAFVCLIAAVYFVFMK
ncbi:DMT family protein [Bacteroides thetaiotaomicron]|uniref:DMT family protein n=2 Tax=Bacteroides thetaiotaomicron TaxID=818 RepID=UPI0035AE265E